MCRLYYSRTCYSKQQNMHCIDHNWCIRKQFKQKKVDDFLNTHTLCRPSESPLPKNYDMFVYSIWPVVAVCFLVILRICHRICTLKECLGNCWKDTDLFMYTLNVRKFSLRWRRICVLGRILLCVCVPKCDQRSSFDTSMPGFTWPWSQHAHANKQVKKNCTVSDANCR